MAKIVRTRKKLKMLRRLDTVVTVLFLLTILYLFLIVGSIEADEISLSAIVAKSALTFIMMYAETIALTKVQNGKAVLKNRLRRYAQTQG